MNKIQPEQLLRQLRVLQLQKKELDMQITEKFIPFESIDIISFPWFKLIIAFPSLYL